MALITIGTNLIDVADVALVAPSGSTSTVYLADGQQLESALTAAAQATAVNGTAAGTLLTTVVVSSNYGSCYISGPNTQRVVELGATGTTWYLRGGPGPVICLTTDIAAAEVLIDATGGAEVPNTYSRSGTYTPTVTTNGSATVAAVLLPGYSRVGNGAGVPLAGDTVTVYGAFTAEGLADGDVVLVSLPFQIAFTVYPWCAAVVIPVEGVTGIVVNSATYSGPDGAFAFAIGVSDTDLGAVSFMFTYQTANAVDPE